MSFNIKKKLAIFFLVLFSTLILVGCTQKKKEEQSKGQEFDIKVASNIVENYMDLSVKNDLEGIKKYYSKEMAKKTKGNSSTELNIRGYKIVDTNEFGKSGLFKIRVVRDKNGYASLDEYNIKVEKEGEDYKINEANNISQREMFQEDNELRMKMKNNVDTSLLINKDGIPSYAFSKDDGANLIKVKVPKSNFGAMNFSYNGDTAVISTYDNDTYLGVVKIDESIATQTQKESGGKENGEGEKPEGGAKEKPIGKEIQTLDIIREGKVEFVLFSPDEKFVVAQYTKGDKVKGIRIYSTENGELLKYKVEEIFPLDKVNISFSSFDKENLIFDVTQKSKADKSLDKIIGKWQLNLKDAKAKKI